MEKEIIVVSDTNVFIDLYSIGLLKEFFSLPWEVHTTDHKGLGPHYHKWKDGKPLNEEPHKLTPAMKKLLKNISDLK